MVIHCDMDGVLVDFDKGYFDLTGIESHITPTLSNNEFWGPIDAAGAAWWANLKWMSDGKQLWNYIKKYNPYILSAPSKNPSSRVGKEAWCKMHLKNEYKDLLLCPRIDKQKYSNVNNIIIDDIEQTIKEWNNRGGIGILHTSAASTIKQLKELGL